MMLGGNCCSAGSPSELQFVQQESGNEQHEVELWHAAERAAK